MKTLSYLSSFTMTESVSEHNAMEPEVKKNNFAYMFQQQLIQAWRPVPTAATSLILYILLGLYFKLPSNFLYYHWCRYVHIHVANGETRTALR